MHIGHAGADPEQVKSSRFSRVQVVVYSNGGVASTLPRGQYMLAILVSSHCKLGSLAAFIWAEGLVRSYTL